MSIYQFLGNGLPVGKFDTGASGSHWAIWALLAAPFVTSLWTEQITSMSTSANKGARCRERVNSYKTVNGGEWSWLQTIIMKRISGDARELSP